MPAPGAALRECWCTVLVIRSVASRPGVSTCLVFRSGVSWSAGVPFGRVPGSAEFWSCFIRSGVRSVVWVRRFLVFWSSFSVLVFVLVFGVPGFRSVLVVRSWCSVLVFGSVVFGPGGSRGQEILDDPCPVLVVSTAVGRFYGPGARPSWCVQSVLVLVYRAVG
ncbi:unnamed protein product [Arctogadus glacialis]